MFFKIHLINKLKKFPCVIASRFIHNSVFKMDKAYLRHLGDGNQFQVTFQYVNEEQKVNRQFNFSRQLSETVESFLSRVTTNVEKVISKKSKKRKSDPNDTKVENGLIKIQLLKDNVELPKETICSEVFQPGNNIVLLLNDQKYEVIVNSPWIETLVLPNSLLATFPTYPAKIESVFTNQDRSIFIWSKSADKHVWSEVGRGYMYTPSNNDIDSFLKLSCIPRNDKFEGPTAETISSCKVEASPGQCPFETRHQFTKSPAVDKEFRVVTYNILADLYCDSDYTREVLHPYCPPYALAIDYRKQLILKEIIGYNADILCLQEVDRKVFKYDLNPILSHLGYNSNFDLKAGEVAEGLAFFYNRNRFKLLESNRYHFAEHIAKEPFFAEVWQQVSKNKQLAERILERVNILQTNVIESTEYPEILVVANTHLYFHPDADHIRLLHGGFAIKYLENFVEGLRIKYRDRRRRISLIFCGDFNSVPECGIYKLFTTGHVPTDFIDYQSNKEQIVEDVELTQKFQLGSACGTPKYTNFTAGFADCLDYIYYERTNLAVSQVVPLPSHEELTQHTALPSIVFPSDHIALISDLKWS